MHLGAKWKKRGYPFFPAWLNRTDPRINLAIPISLSGPCTESLYTRMSELWPCASLRLPERGEGEKAANKQKNASWSCFSLPLHPTHSEAAAQRMSKIQSVLFLYTFLSSISFSPPGSDGKQCLMTHLRYSRTTRREKGRARWGDGRVRLRV